MENIFSRMEKLENKIDVLLTYIQKMESRENVCSYTFHQWLDEWLTVYKAPTVKPATFNAYSTTVRVHIKSKLLDIPLNYITGLDIQKFLTAIPPTRTRKAIYDVLKESFKTAQELKLITDNPMIAVKIPVYEQTKGKSLDNETLNEFKTAIKGHVLEKYFLFLLYSGCRRGEGLSLNRSDVDFEKKIIYIRGTKTKGSERIIPLFENIADLLNDFEPNFDGFYFPFRGDYPTHVFKKLCPKHKLHDLRHTFATTCLSAKIPLKVVQKWLGHSKLDTTADIYSHVTAEMSENEAEILNRYLAKKTV